MNRNRRRRDPNSSNQFRTTCIGLEHLPGHFEMPRHPDLLVHQDRFVEKLSRPVLITRLATVQQHPGVPATHLGLLATDRHVVRLFKRDLEVPLRYVPPLSTCGGDALGLCKSS